MAKVPFPCCCGAEDGCTDYYSADWIYEVSDLVGNAAGYANAVFDVTARIWYYWDATAAIAALNAWAQTFRFDVADQDGPGTLDFGSGSFVVGHRKWLTTTLTLSATLYAANGSATPKPAEFAFTPYVFDWDPIDAVVSVRENVNSVFGRIAHLALYGTASTDPLPGTMAQQGSTPRYGFDTELTGKQYLLDLRSGNTVSGCTRPIPIGIVQAGVGYVGVNTLIYFGWTNAPPPSNLVTPLPWNTTPGGSFQQRGAFDAAP